MNMPVKLILLRILLIPVFLTFLYGNFGAAHVWALAVFAIAALTDLFDGILARKHNQVTNFYTFMDPLADKMLICSAIIALTHLQEFPVWLAILIVCRDFIVTGLRMFAATRNQILGAVVTGKINTCCQMLLVIMILAGLTGPIIGVSVYVVALLTIVSAAENFIRNKNIIRRIKLK
jgi:CDP-diacylglycerol--glycerol-3-phosphate 3-phosphatidyltransferase